MADVVLIGAEELENLGTRYLASVLRAHGYTVSLVPFSTAVEADAALLKTLALSPRLVGLSIIFQYRAPEFLDLAARLRDALPASHITCGGHFVTFAAHDLLRDYPALNSVVRGEGEYTLAELLERLSNPASWDRILGLSFRRDSHVIDNPSRPLVADLDSLPFPARDTPPKQHFGIGYSPVLGSRGCYRHCSFCSIGSFYRTARGQSQRFRSMPNLASEIEELYHRHRVRFFVFNDDEWFPADLGQRESHISALEQELQRRNLDLIMSIKCRADDVEESQFRRLKDLGVVRAYVGIESGSDHSLRALNKGTDAAQNRRSLEILNRVGMLGEFGLIFFDPDSTLDDVRSNLGFLAETAADGQAPLSFGRMEVYAGTPVEGRLRREGRLAGSYLAWNYTIPDPRVELLFRLMITALRHRHYDLNGLGKQSAVACYEWSMYNFANRGRGAPDPALADDLRRTVAGLNRHSLATLQEMLDFVTHENIYDAKVINDQATRWATRANLFDLKMETQLTQWRARLARSAGGNHGSLE